MDEECIKPDVTFHECEAHLKMLFLLSRGGFHSNDLITLYQGQESIKKLPQPLPLS